MRLFVSIDFPGFICEELYGRVPDMKEWRKTPSDQIHLTLFFIGDCTKAEYEIISTLLSGVVFEPFEILTNNFGVFPGRIDPKILWCGVNYTQYLIDLQKSIEVKLEKFRKKPDHKPFFPHITLARRKGNSGNINQIDELLTSDHKELRYIVNRFSLKQSFLKPGGSEHMILKEFRAKVAG
jgi:RNA 2',3'-cyclic 3'-phosphodiesterase